MKNYIFFFFILALAFTSCDGRDRALQSNEERVLRSKLSFTDIEAIKYIPEKAIRSVTDTIIDSNINVKVSYYSSPNKVIEILHKNNKKTKTYYRAFESEIKVVKNNKLLFSKTLSKDNFLTEESNFWNDAVLQYVWLDEFESTDNNYKFYCSFLVPETENYKMYSIHYNNLGNKTIKLLETS